MGSKVQMTSSIVRRLLLFVALATACAAPSGSPPPAAPGQQPRAEQRPTPTLVVATRTQPQSLASRPITGAGGGVAFVLRVFNADLDMIDGQDQARPYLAEALPQLNTESWQVLPDGTMQTRYQLRPNLTWQDGAPLVASDFVFALDVYKTPELGVSTAEPMRLMEEIQAPDPRTVVIRWRALYPAAGVLSSVGSIGNGGFQ